MSDQIIEHANIISPMHIGNRDKPAQPTTKASGPSPVSGFDSLNKDALTVLRSSATSDPQSALETLFSRLNIISEPNSAANESVSDREFNEAFNSIVRGAAENSRTDMNSLFAEFVAMLRDQRYSYNLQRFSNRDVSLSQAAVEMQKMREAAASRKQAEEVAGYSSIAAGIVQIVGGVTALALTFRQIKDLPALAKEAKDLSAKIDGASKDLETAKLEIQRSQNQIDALEQARERGTSISELQLDTGRKALATFRTDHANADAKLVELSGALNVNREKLTEVESYLKLAGAITEIATGASGTIQGIGRVVSAADNYEASMADVDAKRASIRREIAESDLQMFYDMGSHARDLLNQVQQTNQNSQQSLIQTGISINQKMA